MPTLQYCDRDEYLRLLKEEAETQAEPESEQPIDEPTADDANLTNEIAALRTELLAAVTLLRTDLESCLSVVEQTLSGEGVNHGE